MLQGIQEVINVVNNALWSYVLIFLLIFAGGYFSVRTKCVQIRLFKEMFRLMTEGVANASKSEGKNSVSSFQAFCISTASRVGTGNLAGVAIAIAIGGPGAVFWMWVIALIGGASSFVESTLAQIYKIKDENGYYRGGPAYYMEKALNARWMGILFSVLITLSFGLVFNSVQANTISLAFNGAFGVERLHVGIAVTALTALVIFGGVKRIAKVTEMVVPIMATGYVLIALTVVIMNIQMIPTVFKLIVNSAFGLNQVMGAGISTAMMQGIKRGLFSNEAGMGSAPNAAATAEVTHPVKQGLIQTLGVFTDTLLICSATAFMILISGVYKNTDMTGIELTQNALYSQVGSWGNTFIAVCILLFAFSSIIGNYYYGETNIEFIKDSKVAIFLYRAAVVGMVIFGSVSKVAIVWDLADLFMGLMAIMNLIVIVLLGKFAFMALNDYVAQKKLGKNPVFYTENIKGLKNTTCWAERESDLEEMTKIEVYRETTAPSA